MTYESEVLSDSPYLYWRLGEASGTTAADDSGNGRSGTYVNGPTLGVTGLLTGDTDTAVQFISGSSTVVQRLSALGPTTIPTFTLECIIGANISDGHLFGITDPTGTDDIELFLVGGGLLTFAFQGTSGFTATAGILVDTSVKHHIAATFDGTVLNVYVDGSVADFFSFTDAGALFTATNSIGVANWATDAPFGDAINGVIDEAAIYFTALSAARILAHAAAVGAGSAPPTITSLDPPSELVNGGDSIIINGTHLGTVTQVTVGGQSVSFTIVSSVRITFTAPPHAAGPVTVTVTSPDGSASATLTYVTARIVQPLASLNEGYGTGPMPIHHIRIFK